MVAPGGLPKPLTPIAHRPMIDHILSHLESAGIGKVFVVVGFRAEEIRRHLEQGPFAGLVELLHNPGYERPNGVSLQCAAGKLDDPFLLLMSDHLFQAESLRMVLRQGAPEEGGLLAVDSKLDKIFDLEDATKVQRRNGALSRLGKDLETFDAIDTGMFALTPNVFPAMDASIRAGEESLSGGIAELARRSQVLTRDIGHRRWIDVDTPEAAGEAERLWRMGLFQTAGMPPAGADVPGPTVEA